MGLVPSPPGKVEAEAVLFGNRDVLGALGRRAPQAARRQDVDDLPGADDLAEPGPHDRPADRRGDPGAHPRCRRRPPRSAPIEMLELVRDPLAGAAHRRLSAQPVGRHAPARHDRHGAVLRAVAADRRRADHRARRHHPGPDPRPAQRPAAAARHGDPDHHPRSRRHRRGGRRGAGDVRRQDRRERRSTPCSPIPSIPTRSACWARSRASTSTASGWPPSRARCPAPTTSPRAAASRRAARSPTGVAASSRRRCAISAPGHQVACWKAPVELAS